MVFDIILLLVTTRVAFFHQLGCRFCPFLNTHIVASASIPFDRSVPQVDASVVICSVAYNAGGVILGFVTSHVPSGINSLRVEMPILQPKICG